VSCTGHLALLGRHKRLRMLLSSERQEITQSFGREPLGKICLEEGGGHRG
jgi:hypothetical protein